MYQQVAMKLGLVKKRFLKKSFLHYITFTFFTFMSCFLQGQEYAALGALTSDDEPLTSPPGSTEMELKIKQVG